MNLKCGIVGLPNVGKSTLFNALTNSSKAEAANYPFCTIEPNIGIVAIHDERLDTIAKINNSKKTIYSTVEFVDIAGLVKGASQGAGLGNKFLNHIKEVDAIAHVVRCFHNNDIIHVSNKIDPIEDIKIIELELILADLNFIAQQKENLSKKTRTDKTADTKIKTLIEIEKYLNKEQLLGNKYNDDYIKSLNLITSKPMIYICNVDENQLPNGNELSKKVYEMFSKDKCLILSAAFEEELSSIQDINDRKKFLEDCNLQYFGINQLAKAAYKALGLISYFTVGPKEARSWTIKIDTKAPKAAGVIHTDFEKGFIRAEVIKFNNFIQYQGYANARKHGVLNSEGKDYIVQDADIILFRFNV